MVRDLALRWDLSLAPCGKAPQGPASLGVSPFGQIWEFGLLESDPEVRSRRDQPKGDQPKGPPKLAGPWRAWPKGLA
jgi:hypothetical protein